MGNPASEFFTSAGGFNCSDVAFSRDGTRVARRVGGLLIFKKVIRNAVALRLDL